MEFLEAKEIMKQKMGDWKIMVWTSYFYYLFSF